MTSPLTPSKESQRRDLREIRQKLSNDKAAKIDKESRACANVLKILPVHTHLTVGLYAPFGSELDCFLMIPSLLERHYCLSLPQIKGKTMRFVSWDGVSPLVTGPFGIRTPDCTSDELRPDILIVPCLGFNEEQFRLGYGGGFYDRWLAQHRPTPQTIGLAFTEQQAHFAAEAHDYRLDHIVTENGLFTQN